jgi:Flp pilus assembly pilin Flp
MFRNVARWVNKFLKKEDGVTALEYCILFGGISFVILLAGFQGIGPGISDRLGRAFDPAIVLGEGSCPAHNSGLDGNCGVGLGGGGGNGTPNEGNGQGPGPDKDKFDNPGQGNK